MNKFEVFMEIAHTLGQLGTCDRKQVGALIVRDGRCISWGYNGAPPGLPHCEENFHGYLGPNWPRSKAPDALTFAEATAMEAIAQDGCRNATHAEANALAFAARQGISTDGATLFVTVSPCETCARLLIAAGIREVIWKETYRDTAGIDLIGAAGLRGGICP